MRGKLRHFPLDGCRKLAASVLRNAGQALPVKQLQQLQDSVQVAAQTRADSVRLNNRTVLHNVHQALQVGQHRAAHQDGNLLHNLDARVPRLHRLGEGEGVGAQAWQAEGDNRRAGHYLSRKPALPALHCSAHGHAASPTVAQPHPALPLAPQPHPASPAPSRPLPHTCQLFLDWHTAFRKGSSAGMPSADATTVGWAGWGDCNRAVQDGLWAKGILGSSAAIPRARRGKGAQAAGAAQKRQLEVRELGACGRPAATQPAAISWHAPEHAHAVLIVMQIPVRTMAPKSEHALPHWCQCQPT